MTKNDLLQTTLNKLEVLTRSTSRNGIGDVVAVSQVLNSIYITDNIGENPREKGIEQEMTECILKTVSNLVESDLRVPNIQTETKSVSRIGER